MPRVLGVFAFQLAHAELRAVSASAGAGIGDARESLAVGGKLEIDLGDSGGEAGVVPEERVICIAIRWRSS